jgi:hypothetical protein
MKYVLSRILKLPERTQSNVFHVQTNTNMAMMRRFEVIYGRHNTVEVYECHSGNYAKKLIAKLRGSLYQFISSYRLRNLMENSLHKHVCNVPSSSSTQYAASATLVIYMLRKQGRFVARKP